MSTYTKLYWLTRIDDINFLIGMTTFVFIALAIILFLASFFYDGSATTEKDLLIRKRSRKQSITLFCISVVLLIIVTLSPTKKDVMFIIAGGKTVDFIQQDTSINNIPGQTTKIISTFLDQQIKKMETDTIKPTNNGNEKDPANP